ncbi:KH domain-containing protein [bacterium]|nr:KH domain-containing protein [bacterium]
MKELIEYIAKSLVDEKDKVEVNEIEEEGEVTILELRTAPEELGKVIGKGGKIANALRILLNAAAAKADKRVILKITE